MKAFNLCLNGTFQDPATFSNSTYADTLSVVNCQQVSPIPNDSSAMLTNTSTVIMVAEDAKGGVHALLKQSDGE